MTLPTLTEPTDDGGTEISNEDADPEQAKHRDEHKYKHKHKDKDKSKDEDEDIDDTARSKRLEIMRSTVAAGAQSPERSSPNAPADAAALPAKDAKLFLDLYSACFPSTDNMTDKTDGQSISPLGREMMIQMLEDLGDQLLGTGAMDPTVGLRTKIYSVTLGPETLHRERAFMISLVLHV